MTYGRSALRALTLSDNFQWLRSFGCTVEERAELTFVDHPSLPEYKAWLFTRATPEAIRQLGGAVSGELAGPRTMWVDQEAANTAVLALVGRMRTAGRNITLAARVPARAWRSAVQLLAADANDWASWSDLYSRGFSREDLAAVDRDRWRQAFRSTGVQHWFLVGNGSRIGVCQTTSGPVHGIYSFTLLPEARGVGSALNGIRAVLGYVSRQQSPWMYFEVMGRSPVSRMRLQSVPGLTNVRTLTGYELPDAGRP